jgi:ADP-heptose:LPS heptosyltransferase
LARALALGAKPEVWIRFPRQLGDVVFTLPFVDALRRAWEPEAARLGVNLRWVASGHAIGAGLFQEAAPSYFDATLLDETSGKLDPLRLAARWRRTGRPAAVFVLGQSARLAMAAWLAGVPLRAGIADNGLRFLFHASVPYRGVQRHLADRLGRLAERLAYPAPLQPRLEVCDLRGEGGLAALLNAGWDGREPLIALAPGTRAEGKRWRPEREKWPALARHLEAQGLRPVVLGTAEEASLAAAIRMAVPKVLDLTGRTTLPEAAQVLHAAGAAVAVDTGLAHLAAALGCATVTLFGPSEESRALPAGPWSLALRGQPLDATPGLPVLRDPHADPSLARLEPGRVAAILGLLRVERDTALEIPRGA